MAVFPMVKGVPSGGGAKVVTGHCSVASANTPQTVTVDGLTQIDELIVYFTSTPSISMSAFVLNGNFYANNYAVTPSQDKITAINGNQFTFYWQAVPNPNDFTYIAIQNG